MLSNHFILCHPLLLLPSVFPSIRVFSNVWALCIRWPKYLSFSFSITPSSEYSGLISFRMDWLDLLAVQGTLKSLLQHHNWKASIPQRLAFLMVQLTHRYITTGKTVAVMYGCESWTIRKAEHRRIDAFELWCWRRLSRVPWTKRRSNQSILKEISPEYSLEGLKLKYFGHLMQRADSLEKTLMLGKNEGKRRRGQQRMTWLDNITDSMNMNLSKFHEK